MEVGKLYKTKQFYWILYRSENDVDFSRWTAAATSHAPFAQFWSTRSQNLPYIPPSSLFVLLEHKQQYCKVLSPEGNVGWIYLARWCSDDIEEVLFREAE